MACFNVTKHFFKHCIDHPCFGLTTKIIYGKESYNEEKEINVSKLKFLYLQSSVICSSILSRSSTSSSSKSVWTVTSRVYLSRAMTSKGARSSGLSARAVGVFASCSCRTRLHAAQPHSEPRTRNSHTSPNSAIHVVMLRHLPPSHTSLPSLLAVTHTL